MTVNRPVGTTFTKVPIVPQVAFTQVPQVHRQPVEIVPIVPITPTFPQIPKPVVPVIPAKPSFPQFPSQPVKPVIPKKPVFSGVLDSRVPGAVVVTGRPVVSTPGPAYLPSLTDPKPVQKYFPA